MTTEADPASASHERLFAAMAFGASMLFAAWVVAHEALTLASLARLVAAYVGVFILLFGTALLCFIAVSFVRTGLRSNWTQSPVAGIAGALRQRWHQDRLLTLAWPLATFLLLIPAFNGFKQRILREVGFVHDPALAAADRLLFGVDPGLWLHQTIGSPALTGFFDAVYHSWFVPTTLGLCVVGLCAGTRTRAQYMLAYVGTWILLGAVLAFAFPAAGPAFYQALVDPASAAPFVEVHANLVAATTDARFLTSIYNQQYLLTNLDNPVLVVGGGISAIPSIHNAMAVLFALASFRAHWLAGVTMSLFALLIWVASVYLNWHYAVDGLAGALGAVVLWFGAGKLVDVVMAIRSADRQYAPQALPAS